MFGRRKELTVGRVEFSNLVTEVGKVQQGLVSQMVRQSDLKDELKSRVKVLEEENRDLRDRLTRLEAAVEFMRGTGRPPQPPFAAQLEALPATDADNTRAPTGEQVNRRIKEVWGGGLSVEEMVARSRASRDARSKKASETPPVAAEG